MDSLIMNRCSTQVLTSILISDIEVLTILSLQRITIKEIKTHPWFLKNLPRELTEPAQAIYYSRKENPTFSPQSVDDIMKIVEEAKSPPPASRFLGGFGWGEDDDEVKEEEVEEEDDDEEDEYEKRVKEAHESMKVEKFASPSS